MADENTDFSTADIVGWEIHCDQSSVLIKFFLKEFKVQIKNRGSCESLNTQPHLCIFLTDCEGNLGLVRRM